MYHKTFKRNSVSKLVSVIGGKSQVVTSGWYFGGNSLFLVVGETLNRVLAIATILNKKIIYDLKQIEFNFNDILPTFKKYKNYPMFFLPGSWITVTTNQIPIYLLANYYTFEMVGYFSYTASLLTIPIIMIGNSVSSVFIQRASEHASDNKYLGEITLKLFKKLILIGLFPFSVVAAYGDVIFKFVLGDKWEMSGVFASYLSAYYLILFLYNPIASLFRVLKKEKSFFTLNLITFIGVGASVWLSTFFVGATSVILIFSISSIFFILIKTFYIFNQLEMEKTVAKIILPLIIISISFLLAFTSRWGILYLLAQ